MARFWIGFTLGAIVGAASGAAAAIFLAPETGGPVRVRVREMTDQYAAGNDSPIEAITRKIRDQRARFDMALEAGKVANEQKQAELWSELHLPPPADAPPDSTALTPLPPTDITR